MFRKYNVKRPTSYTHLGYREPTTPRKGGGVQKLLCIVTIQGNHTSRKVPSVGSEAVSHESESGLPAVSCARGSKDNGSYHPGH